MQDLKISLITVSFNAENTINRCIQSVLSQTFKNIEYIVIDGGSTDKTVSVIERYKPYLTHLISEPDNGIYDAMNKGIRLAQGHIIGMLNADDYFADETILSTIAGVFKKNTIDIVYGDLDYINKSGKVIRRWRSGEVSLINFNLGWMPAHPTFYCKRYFFEKFGSYSLHYGTAADYELMLRFLYTHKLQATYINKVIIKMENGGKSNRSLNNRVKGLFNDLKAMKHNGIPLPYVTLILKPILKLNQYF